MSGLIACSLQSSKTYFEKRGEAPKDYTSEFRGRGESLWSQTTSSIVPLDPADLLPSSTDPILQGRRDLPLYAGCGSSVPAGARRPRNLFLKGTNFLCGEDVTCPQDHSSTGTSLDTDLRTVGRRREQSFSLHQAIIHEVSPAARGTRPKHSDDKYLDMSVQEVHSTPHGPGREYVNLETRVPTEIGNAKSPSDKEETSGYLPMEREWKGREEEGGTCTPISSAEVTGSQVEAVGPVDGDKQVTLSLTNINSQPFVTPNDDDHLNPANSDLETSGDATFMNIEKDGTQQTVTARRRHEDEA